MLDQNCPHFALRYSVYVKRDLYTSKETFTRDSLTRTYLSTTHSSNHKVQRIRQTTAHTVSTHHGGEHLCCLKFLGKISGQCVATIEQRFFP